ncbi:hypothetical protein GA0061078_0566 [Bifidobacterium bohemicum]|nr:hypothetical protein GA0061078_0566 [Bifidobacterium bohemicum]
MSPVGGCRQAKGIASRPTTIIVPSAASASFRFLSNILLFPSYVSMDEADAVAHGFELLRADGFDDDGHPSGA